MDEQFPSQLSIPLGSLKPTDLIALIADLEELYHLELAPRDASSDEDDSEATLVLKTMLRQTLIPTSSIRYSSDFMDHETPDLLSILTDPRPCDEGPRKVRLAFGFPTTFPKSRRSKSR